jgi:hypothetical protein
VFHPIFTRELLDGSQLLGFALSLQNPVRGRLLLKAPSVARAQELARLLHDEPHRWLHLAESDLLLFTENPNVSQQDATIELNFSVPENSARLLLQRLAKSDVPAVVAAQQSDHQ